MDVGVEDEGLSPGVEHGETSGLDAEAAGGDVEQGRAGSAEQQIVEEARCVESDDVERLGHGEDDVKIGNGEKLVTSRVEPAQAGRTAAAGTASVAARMPLHVLVAAAIAELALPAE